MAIATTFKIEDFDVHVESTVSEDGNPCINVIAEFEGIDASVGMGYNSIEERNKAWDEMTEEKVRAIFDQMRRMILQEIEKQVSFYDEAMQVRNDFSKVAATYDVRDHLKLRTEIDTLLIMYDQAIDKARKWDELGEKIGKYYDPENEDSEHLLDIGVEAATAFNYL